MVNTAFTVNSEGKESGARWRRHGQEREREKRTCLGNVGRGQNTSSTV